jgi:K+-sensing histidine kinase KdpD
VHVPASARSASVREPWFRARPEITIAVSVICYAAIFTLRLLMGDARDAYSMLYVLPVALLATAFGGRVGTIAGVVAVALVVVWVVVDDVTLSPMGWLSRVVPLLVLGVLVGDAADRLRRADEERAQLAAAARLHQEAIEINDSLIQGMAAAKWSLEAGRTETALATLDETIALGHRLVSGLIREAGIGSRSTVVAARVQESQPSRSGTRV